MRTNKSNGSNAVGPQTRNNYTSVDPKYFLAFNRLGMFAVPMYCLLDNAKVGATKGPTSQNGHAKVGAAKGPTLQKGHAKVGATKGPTSQNGHAKVGAAKGPTLQNGHAKT